MHDPEGNARTTHYGWDGDRLVHEDRAGLASTTVVHEPGSFVPLLRLDAEGDTTRPGLYLNDPLGTPLRLLAPDGRVRWRAQPDDWAAVRDEVGETQPIRFQGQWHDEESGLYYNRHRYYDPQAGRYISQDPIGLMGGLNLYGYATDPVSMVDPMGLSAWERIKYHAQMIPKFIADEGFDVLSRTATVVGGGGQVLLGIGLCSTGLGAVAGVPIATLGASNIQEGFSKDGSGFARDMAVQLMGDRWGSAAVDGANIGTSFGGLAKSVTKPEIFRLYRNISSDYEPAFRQSTKVGLGAEIFSSGTGVYGGIKNQMQANEYQND